MPHNIIISTVGFGNNGTLAEKQKCLAWWERSKNPNTARAQQRIKALRREIAEMRNHLTCSEITLS